MKYHEQAYFFSLTLPIFRKSTLVNKHSEEYQPQKTPCVVVG